MPKEARVWVIRAGKDGGGEPLCLEQNVVAIGWRELGDLRLLRPNRESFRAQVKEVFRTARLEDPSSKKKPMEPGAVTRVADQLFGFVYDVRPGDLAILPAKLERGIVHIARVQGSYSYEPGLNLVYPNHRKVEWLKRVPKKTLSGGAQTQIDRMGTVFEVKKEADELRAIASSEQTLTAVPGTNQPPQSGTNDLLAFAAPVGAGAPKLTPGERELRVRMTDETAGALKWRRKARKYLALWDALGSSGFLPESNVIDLIKPLVKIKGRGQIIASYSTEGRSPLMTLVDGAAYGSDQAGYTVNPKLKDEFTVMLKLLRAKS